MHIGVDFGSKLAGTTAICYTENNQLFIHQSEKKKDADAFILQHIERLKATHVFIDAPLSLPNAYYGKGSDFMFRKADRDVQAMSPMFLGGLTARAMRLQHTLKSKRIPCFEAYPKQTAINYFKDISHLYKEKDAVTSYVDGMHALPIQPNRPVENWHQVDAILAWYVGYRNLNNTGKQYGDPDEGIILA